jgi:hypothetical protein
MGSRIGKVGPQAVATMKVGDVLWDSELRRFGARRRTSGTTYFIKARIDGHQRWLTLGRHGPLTPSDARVKAKHALGEIDSGKDPTRHRAAGRTIPYFAEFAQRWLREHVALKRKPNTLAAYRRIVDQHLTPSLGKVRIDRIDRADALKIHTGLAAQRYIANRFYCRAVRVDDLRRGPGISPPSQQSMQGDRAISRGEAQTPPRQV